MKYTEAQLAIASAEKVVCYVSDLRIAKWEMRSRFIGIVKRQKAFGIFSAELLGTGSQDSEGHNISVDVNFKALRKLKK